MSGCIARVIAGVIFPAPIAVILIFIAIVSGSASTLDSSEIVSVYNIWLIFAYLMIGLQSVLYSLIMEFLINRKLNNNYQVISISCFLGAFFGSLELKSLDFHLTEITTLGAFTGVITGVILRTAYQRAANKAM